MTSGLKGQLAKWPEYRLRFLLEKTRSVDEFRRLERVREVSFIPMENIGEKGEIDTSQVKLKGEVSNGYTLFFEGDVLVAKITPCFENGKGAVARELIGGIGFGTTELYVLDPGAKLHEQFLYYITVSEHFRKLGEASMKGAAGQKRVPDEFIQDYRFRLPPLETQRRIADYLDRETARIDALIAEKEKMLALLEEKRTALISRAVTRGLNPDAPMKPSGLDWLGDIPADWEVVQVRFVCPDLQTGPFGSQLHADEYIDHGVPVINPAHLRGNEIEPDYGISVDEATADRLRMHRLKTGDVVFARRGELGRCSVIKSEQAGWLCGTGSLRVRCDLRRTNPNYLALVFNSTNAAKRLTVESVGSTMDNLNTEMLGHFRIPFPELDEQNSIVSYVFVVEEKIRALMEVLRRSIDLAKERRAALITAAVTGRIDLEGMAA